MEGESGVTRSTIDELHSGILNEIKWKVKVMLLEIINELLSSCATRSNGTRKWCYSKYH